jgi:hypothetical protein
MSTQALPLFGRKYDLIITTTAGEVIPVSSSASDTLGDAQAGEQPLKFTFEIDTSALADMWTATFKIYNLNYATSTTLINQGSTVQLSAGYVNGQNYGVIWIGKVLWVEVTKENVTDYVLTIQSVVGSNLINKQLSLATGPFQTQRQLITQMAQAANLTIQDPGGMLNNTAQLPCPKVFFGQPRDYLRTAARQANTWGFPDFAGNINILSLTYVPKTPSGQQNPNGLDPDLLAAVLQQGQPTPNTNPEIIYSTPIPPGSTVTPDPAITYSIVGTPRQTLINDTNWGIGFKVLCDSRLTIKALPQLIKIDASALIEQAAFAFGTPPPVLSQSGVYAVVAIAHYGDSRANAWYSQVLALSVGQGTSIGFPSAQGKDNRYINTTQSNPQGQ